MLPILRVLFHKCYVVILQPTYANENESSVVINGKEEDKIIIVIPNCDRLVGKKISVGGHDQIHLE